MESSDTTGSTSATHDDSLAGNSLERIRQRLVDTSARNRLINCRQDRTQVIRLVDELPDQVYERLVEGKPFTMAPVPAPTHEELLAEGYIVEDEQTGERIRDTWPKPDVWARRLGIDTDYDLPSGTGDELNPAHTDNQLQTLLFPDTLNARLNRLRHLAQTAMEESGTNILYLALGFLEWYESPSSTTPRLSPLFVVPVDLERAQRFSSDGLRSYQLTLRDDGLLNNVSLSQRLSQDFYLNLPEVTDNSQPEAYFKAVRQSIAAMDSRWSVRRYASLCLLDFTKQLMYEDLDPARWPEESNLTDHPLLQQFLRAGEQAQQESSSATLAEHDIDHIEHIHTDYPLIFEADSSQHSALIDAARGRNLVIEGPPGTGKSQTITNLIAACINKGMSVLFVAEKLAALEVVKRRLDSAELGDFCLELHSHKSSKLAILGSLMDGHRRREQVQAPSALDQQIQRYEKHKQTLHLYADKLNQPWQNTGLTPHQVLQRATDLGERSPLAAGEHVVLVSDPASVSDGFISDTCEAAERLRSVFEAVASQTPEGSIDTHPWFGLRQTQIAGPQRQALIDALQTWTDALQQVLTHWADLQKALQINMLDAPPDQEQMTRMIGTLAHLPDTIPESLLSRVDELKDHAQALDGLAEQRSKLRARLEEFATAIHEKDLLNAEQSTQAARALLHIRDGLGLTDKAPLEKVAAHADQLDSLRRRMQALQQDTQALRSALPAEFDDTFTLTPAGLDALSALLDVARALPEKLWRFRHDRYSDTGFLPALDDMEPTIHALRERYKALTDLFNMDQLPDSRTLQDIERTLANAGWFGFLKSDYRAARRMLRQLSRMGVKASQSRSNLPALIRFQQDVAELDTQHRRNPVLADAYKGLDTHLKPHRLLAQWYALAREKLGDEGYRESRRAAALFSMGEQAVQALLDAANSDLIDRVTVAQDSIKKVQALYPGHFKAVHAHSDLIDSAAGITGLKQALEDALVQIGRSMRDSTLPISTLIELSTRWSTVAIDHQQWLDTEDYQRFVPSLFDISAHPGTDDERACESLDHARLLSSLAASSTLFRKAMQQEPTMAQLARLRDAQPVLQAALNKASDAQSAFEAFGDIERAHWLSGCDDLSACHARNERALQQPDWLDTWLSYQRVKQRPGFDTLERLTEKLEAGSLAPDQVHLAIQADLYQRLALHMMISDAELADMDGNEIQAIREQFQQYDKALLTLQRQQIASNCSGKQVPAGNNRGAVGTYSELALIQHEASKKRKHIAIRALLKRSATAIQTLKPCFMMSPMSVAQYLEPGRYEFDVIIMDEASQIRPEEALGAIARAKQMVVVGDPKQLPPTSFFSRMASDDDQDDEEDVGLERAESILDAVIPLFPTRRLRWHYRSRHESLIAFSNQKYYDSDLVLFPSPFSQTKEFGIHFTHLDNGIFNEQVNTVEAEHIVARLAEQLQQRPNESVGVVAMNIKQRDQIEAQWENRLASDNLLQAAYERAMSTEEPVFFKNLENVQGDERDVIIISMTYGPQSIGGTTYQRFGPINSDVGWRRLNVLLTRSKKRMEIISSMGSGDVRADSNSKLGVRSLRALLEYCETGHLQSTNETGKAPDSAFEVAVMRKLAAAGYDCEPQVGVAGFFIDLAVRNPDRPGEFLMGIECDGATYHSAKSARDRDRLRQEVLEGLGWNIRRIWSTDWFRNAESQMNPIVAELDRMRASRWVQRNTLVQEAVES